MLFRTTPTLAIWMVIIWPYWWWPYLPKPKNCHNSRCGYGNILVSNMATIGTVLKIIKNAVYQRKQFPKCIHLSKVMAKRSHGPKFRPFPLYFKSISGRKCGFQRQPFPLEFRGSFNVFGIREVCRMGAACKLIKIQTFCFYDPPNNNVTWYLGTTHTSRKPHLEVKQFIK